MNTTYGEMLKTHRKTWGLTLRQMGERVGIDAANLSRVENGVLKPPMSPAIVLRVQQGCGWGGSEKGLLLSLLAAIENGRLPKWVKEDEDFLREVGNFIWKRRART